MAGTGGTAFVSEYFDKTSTPVDHTTGHEPAFGTQATRPPMYHQAGQSSKGRGTIIVSVVLRLLTFLFAVIALAVLAASKGAVGVADTTGDVVPHTVRFTTLGGLKFLFAACCIVAVYSLAMMAVSLVSLCATPLTNNRIVLWIIFVCDQVLAYVLISAGAAGANGVVMSINDENISGIALHKSCENIGLTGFCNKAAASVGLAFAAFLFLAFTSVLSSRRLFRH